jgi:transposase
MVRIGEDKTERLDRVPARYEVIVTIRPKYACPKGRTGVVQAKAPAHLLEGSWPTEALLAEIAVSKHSEHMPLNRQAEVMARHGVPIDRTVLADWMGRTGSEIAPVVDHMAKRLLWESTSLYVDETTAPGAGSGARPRQRPAISGPCCATTAAGMDLLRQAWCSIIGLGVKANMPLRSSTGSTARSRWMPTAVTLTSPRRTASGGDPLKLAFCWAHGRRKLIKATPKSGSPIVDEALLRIAALYKIEDSIRGSDPEHRRAVRQDLSLPLVDEFFTWLAAQAARVSRKSDLGKALAYMLKRQDGFRLFLDDGCVDIDSNLVENAIRSPAMNRRNALFAGHDEGGRNWARFASLIGTAK